MDTREKGNSFRPALHCLGANGPFPLLVLPGVVWIPEPRAPHVLGPAGQVPHTAGAGGVKLGDLGVT